MPLWCPLMIVRMIVIVVVMVMRPWLMAWPGALQPVLRPTNYCFWRWVTPRQSIHPMLSFSFSPYPLIHSFYDEIGPTRLLLPLTLTPARISPRICSRLTMALEKPSMPSESLSVAIWSEARSVL